LLQPPANEAPHHGRNVEAISLAQRIWPHLK
jgi:hypothetical protein